MFQPDRPAPTGSVSLLAEWCLRQFLKLQEFLSGPRDRLPMQYLSALPAKPRDGLYLFAADVTSGGAARGLYRYDESTDSYTAIS